MPLLARRFYLLCLLLLCVNITAVQAQPVVQWERTVADWPYGASVTEAADGSLYVVGNTAGMYSNRNVDNTICLLKLSPDGQIQWTRTFENPDRPISAAAVLPTSDDGVVLAGTQRWPSAFATGYLHKLDAEGNTVWERFVGTVANHRINGAARTREGDYVLAGHANYNALSNPYLVKTNADGWLLWEQEYALPHSEQLNALTVLPNGDIAAVGEMRIVEADTIIYRRGIGLFALRTEGGGSLMWADTLTASTFTSQGIWGNTEIGRGVAHLGDQLLVAGMLYLPFVDPGRSAFLTGADGQGITQWTKSVHPTWDHPDIMYPTTNGWAIAATSQGEVLVGGGQFGANFTTEEFLDDGLVAAFNSNGVFLWSMPVGDPVLEEALYVLASLQNGDILVAGRQANSLYSGPGAMYVARLTYDAATTQTPASDRQTTTLSTPHPHPVRHTATVSFNLRAAERVTLELFDMLGRRVETLVDKPQSAGTHHVTLHSDALASGAYFLRLTTTNTVSQQPVIVAK